MLHEVMPTGTAIKVSIIIKALNEADNIERCVRSCLEAVAGIASEVILADSLSTDATVELAARYPIRIVQLRKPGDRSCGVAAQLGYLHANGEYLYIIDGDMELPGEFLHAAINLLDARPEVAGVGGQLEEIHADSHLSRFRASRNKPRHQIAGAVDRLNGGGLYRAAAIREVGGYLTHPGLHAFEELELALRLRHAGWTLWRLDLVSMRHAAHTDNPLALLMRRWKTRYAFGSGELLRSSLGTDYFMDVVREFKLHFAVWVWWLVILLTSLASVFAQTTVLLPLAILLAPFLAMILRKRNLLFGVYAVLTWNVFSAGMLRGVLAQLKTPVKPPEHGVLHDRCSEVVQTPELH